MQTYVGRNLERELRLSLSRNPVTALIGPRQCGKSTLARHVLSERADGLLLDLELPSDLRKLSDPELFLNAHADRLVGIDEIQRRPDLFPVLRALVDQDRRPGRFLLLGSASRDLVRQGGETLAGRIHYIELTPFTWIELMDLDKAGDFRRLWWRGGFPPAFLAQDDRQSMDWKRDLVRDYLTRDVPLCGYRIPEPSLDRFWRMLAHHNGSILNASKLGQSLDVSHNTVRKYLDLLEQTFMVRVLRPLRSNAGKRLVKAPKVYFRDSGLLHTLLEVETETALFGHPGFGASWESWCIEQVVAAVPGWQPSFYRTSTGEEIDLILDRGNRRLAFEFKASLSPHLSRGFRATIESLRPERTFVVCPLTGPGYPLQDSVWVVGPTECVRRLQERP